MRKAHTLIGAFALVMFSSTQADSGEPYRLAEGIEPVFQQITLTLDPDQAEYSGSTSIELTVTRNVDRIEFYQSDLELNSIRLKSGDGVRILTAEPAAYNINRASDGQPIKAGEYVLEIDFGGNLATNALGMYQTPNQQEHGPGYRNIRVSNLVEDPYFKDSRDSYCVQAADLAAFLLDQKFAPSSYIKRKYAQNYFNRLQPVLCTVASSSNPDGIVHL